MTLLQFWLITGSLAVIAVACGLARLRYRSAPLLASAAIIVLSLVYLLVVFGWAASCWRCETAGASELNRAQTMVLLYMTGVMYGVGALALVWTGAGLAALVGWILRLEDPGRAER